VPTCGLPISPTTAKLSVTVLVRATDGDPIESLQPEKATHSPAAAVGLVVAVQSLERVHVLGGEAHPVVLDGKPCDRLQRRTAGAGRAEIELLLQTPVDPDGNTSVLDFVAESVIDGLDGVDDRLEERQQCMTLRQTGVANSSFERRG